MFEVLEIGQLSKKRWFSRRRYRPVKLKALAPLFCEELSRKFEGYQKYSVQTYRADFSEGSVVTVWLRESEMIAVGDKLSVEALAGQGYLNPFFRLIKSNY